MTVATEACYAERAWTGAETSFNPGFSAMASAHVALRFRTSLGVETNLINGANVTVTKAGADGQAGAISAAPIALPSAPGTVIFERVTPAIQGTNFSDLAGYSATTHTALHDAAAMRAAELRRLTAQSADLSAAVTEAEAAADRAEAAAALAESIATNSVASIAALRALAASAAPALDVTGCVVPGKGGGKFVWSGASTAADDTIFVVKPNTVLVGSPGRWLRVHDADEVSAYWAGVTGGDAAADTAAIQNALDAVSYRRTAGVVKLPSIEIALNGPLHMAYGTGFQPANLRGANTAYQGQGGFGSALTAAFSDAPVIEVQGGRFVTIEKLGIAGPNLAWFNAHPQTTNPLDSIDPALAAIANSRYAPQCAIAMDPRSGAQQADHYRDVIYPAFLGAVAQYGKNFSSILHLQDLHLRGHIVAVAQQPNVGYGNGDFLTMKRVLITECIYGVSISGSQARMSGLEEVYFSNLYCCLTSNVHGTQNGRFSNIVNCHVGQSILVFDFGSLSIVTVNFDALYGEDMYQIGILRGATAVEVPLIFRDPRLSFEFQLTGGRGTPAYQIKATNPKTPLKFDGGHLVNFTSVMLFDVETAGVKVDNTQMEPNGTYRAALYEQFAHNALAGGLAFYRLGSSQNLGDIRPKYTAYNLDTGAQISTITTPAVFPSKRDRCTPIWAKRHTGNTHPEDEGIALPDRTNILNIPSSFSSITRSGRILTMVFASRSEATFAYFGPLPGDILMFATGGSIFFVKSRTALTVTAELQNNFKPAATVSNALNNGAGLVRLTVNSTAGMATGNTRDILNVGGTTEANGSFPITVIDATHIDLPVAFVHGYSGGGMVGPIDVIDAIDLTTGLLVIANSRFYAPETNLYGDFTHTTSPAGSPIITNVGRLDGYHGLIEENIAVGDYYYADTLHDNYIDVALSKVTARSNSARTITLDGNANRTVTGVRLGTFIRMPAPNG